MTMHSLRPVVSRIGVLFVVAFASVSMQAKPSKADKNLLQADCAYFFKTRDESFSVKILKDRSTKKYYSDLELSGGPSQSRLRVTKKVFSRDDKGKSKMFKAIAESLKEAKAEVGSFQYLVRFSIHSKEDKTREIVGVMLLIDADGSLAPAHPIHQGGFPGYIKTSDLRINPAYVKDLIAAKNATTPDS